MPENYSISAGNRNKFFDLQRFVFSISVENGFILWKNG